MKKLLSLVLVLVLMGSFSALADESIDLQNAEISKLLDLKSKIDEELYNRGGLVVLLPGTYVVGADIASGSYDLVPYMGSSTEAQYWKLAIYLNSEAMVDLDKAYNAYLDGCILTNRARDTDKDAAYPERIDFSLYVANPDNFDSDLTGAPMRIVLKDGQIMKMEYRVYDGTLNITISKTTPLFMK